MKLNILFLLIGLLLSVCSKWLQAINKAKVGNVLVIPAAIFFVLAILFTIPKFTALLDKENGLKQATLIAFSACLAVVSFQVMMILLIGHHNKWGFLLLLPLVIGVMMLFNQWRML